MMDGLLDIIRREAAIAVAQTQKKSTLIATSYDPKTHTVKGILMPHNVESGWIPIGAIHIGNGFGIAIGPKVGSAEKLDGDQFDVDFEGGDANGAVARHRMFSSKDKPPEVQSGEMILKHESGTSMMMDKDGQWKLDHGPSKGSMLWDKNGVINTKANGLEQNFENGVKLTASGGGHLA